MANQTFSTIALIGKPQHAGAAQTLQALYIWLKQRSYEVVMEARSADGLEQHPERLLSLPQIGKEADLAIVVGGDGNMLRVARVLSKYPVAVIGVNRGNLGFLTDLDPEQFHIELAQVLEGQYQVEKRFLLEAKVVRHDAVKSRNSAVNEVVLHADKVAQMLEFEVYIDNEFMLSQRADGLIVSTPTGSTAYSLSGGGPILTPDLNALSLVPMFPHTLSSRPIVIDNRHEVRLKLSHNNQEHMQISCDSHVSLAVMPGDEVIIRKQSKLLKLVHPLSYNYFSVLRQKLHWGSKLF
ncbi:NAD(+) kinase [Alginatibacterium sediminis]|uniref:NAD kinase n=1 Tax=Alginatibacterium sediminis TaxID=2164068 RepID=A0A420E892_9ALTE|nr:NAD(+) kinase [Alginatibacterium sediminis]RKF15625.1 NAD(+) kinase [Alginatibacterium sediminis]